MDNSATNGLRFLPATFEGLSFSRVASDDKAADAIAVLMSGGVDSSVTASLLKEAGWRTVGITMRVPTGEAAPSPCCGIDAAVVCRRLGIPHYFVETLSVFEQLVVAPFRDAYGNGRTPNPCIVCNSALKFGLVWDLLERELGVRHLATGHYARVVRDRDSGRVSLNCGIESARDQSYFIYGIPGKRLPFLHLPLGEYTKEKVREMARALDLPVAEKPDSMELCFADGGDYRRALGGGAGEPGPILDLDGAEIGRHAGLGNFTVGQRRGLRVAADRPLYAVRLDPERNAVVAGGREALMQPIVTAVSPNYLRPPEEVCNKSFRAKLRSRMEAAPCFVEVAEPDRIVVRFDEAQFAPTPGQHLVLYTRSGEVVAGGEIVP